MWDHDNHESTMPPAFYVIIENANQEKRAIIYFLKFLKLFELPTA